MTEYASVLVETIQFHRSAKIDYRTLTHEHYSAFISNLLGLSSKSIKFRNAFEVEGSPAAYSKLIGYLRRLRKSTMLGDLRVVVFEVLDDDIDANIYDDLCISILASDLLDRRPLCLAFAVANPYIFRESVVVSRKLIPLCEDQSVGLIVMSPKPGQTAEIVCPGPLPQAEPLPAVMLPVDSSKVTRLPASQIRHYTDVLAGHFSLNRYPCEGDYHLPVVISVRRLATNPKFVQQLHADVSRMLSESRYSVFPMGVPLGGIDDLAFNLVQADGDRLIRFPSGVTPNDTTALVLCDLIGPMYPIGAVVSQLLECGFRDVAVVGIARLANEGHVKITNVLSYFELPYRADKAEKCLGCLQSGELTEGEHFYHFLRSAKEYASFSFWELLREDESYRAVGHWVSSRTPNHYLFRIMARSLFRARGFEIANRMVNSLASKGILSHWIQKIVIPKESEARLLAVELAKNLGLNEHDDVVEIPRSILRTVAGKDIQSKLPKSLTVKTNSLKGRNVIIIDQAAHHLKTLSALYRVCGSCDALVLAISVFVDRSVQSSSDDPFLYNCHYVPLYSWPCRPRLKNECLCKWSTT